MNVFSNWRRPLVFGVWSVLAPNAGASDLLSAAAADVLHTSTPHSPARPHLELSFLRHSETEICLQSRLMFNEICFFFFMQTQSSSSFQPVSSLSPLTCPTCTFTRTHSLLILFNPLQPNKSSPSLTPPALVCIMQVATEAENTQQRCHLGWGLQYYNSLQEHLSLFLARTLILILPFDFTPNLFLAWFLHFLQETLRCHWIWSRMGFRVRVFHSVSVSRHFASVLPSGIFSAAAWSNRAAARAHVELSGLSGRLVDGGSGRWNKGGDCKLVSRVVPSRPRLSVSLHASPSSPPVNLNRWCRCIRTHQV